MPVKTASMLALAVALPLSFPVLSVEPPAAARAEIIYLLDQLGQSGCEFYRNGSWYTAADARAHLDKKYSYLLDKGLVSKAEDFIEGAASHSSLSGKPYEVRCGNNTPVTSSEWLTNELRLHRQKSSNKK